MIPIFTLDSTEVWLPLGKKILLSKLQFSRDEYNRELTAVEQQWQSEKKNVKIMQYWYTLNDLIQLENFPMDMPKEHRESLALDLVGECETKPHERPTWGARGIKQYNPITSYGI